MNPISPRNIPHFTPKDSPERIQLADELRIEVDKIRYQWRPPEHLTNEKLRIVINLLRGHYVFIDEVEK